MPSQRAEELASGAEAEYWDGLLSGDLRIQRCASCGKWHWPAVWRCASCGSWEHRWESVPLEGRVFSWTRTWHPFGGLEALEKPFLTGVIELKGADGARLMGIIEEDDAVAIGDVVTGKISENVCFDNVVPTIRWSR